MIYGLGFRAQCCLEVPRQGYFRGETFGRGGGGGGRGKKAMSAPNPTGKP